MDHRKFEIPADLEVGLNRYRRASNTPSLGNVVLWVLVIALGIFIGQVLYTKYMIHEVTKGLDQINSEMAASNWAESERARQQRLAIERERTRRKQLEIQVRQAEIARRNAESAAARRKEAAWDRYYQDKRPNWCENANTQTAMVDCGNIYMRERAKFERQWSSRQDRLVIQ